ncbi:LysR family transcriptional regulator [Parendozoicomonas haliclonae]|uniref:Nodulation protein D 2 n=1 Tax=Parendozoicomonas haliclonae TaxID=1960125 RepID=A0A1X7AQM3_9GAMM|nr:LysR family transcriptional regulator [Parendozoicomonas haliclonae]SMA50611.1 Nodulation protein D 2 [Parendozoicomonas haliclonae]
MSLLELSRINLNLLVCLQVLLETRSVTLTAERLNLSQSAVSKMLARLRELCSDPLFTRTAHGLLPTERALIMQEQLHPLLEGLWDIVQPHTFQPAECQRHFHIALPESITQNFFQQSLNQILTQAPGVKLNIKNFARSDMAQLTNGQMDILVLPDDLDCGQDRIAGLHSSALHPNTLVCLVRNNHPCLKEPWNLQTWLNLRHVGMEDLISNSSIVDQTLHKLQLKREIVVAVNDFHSATGVCENSELALVCTRPWADYASRHYDVTILPVPITLPQVSYEVYWHQRHHQDPAHQWLRSFICRPALYP